MLHKMIAHKFYERFSAGFKSPLKHIPLHEPFFTPEDSMMVSSTIKSGWVSYQGEMVRKFEEDLAKYLDVPYIISTVNGTVSLFLSIKGMGIGPGDEVLMPSLTFSATANAVIHAGASPHFVDSDFETFNINYARLEEYLENNTVRSDIGGLINKHTRNPIKAIIPVHILGSSGNLDKIKELAKKFSLSIIEDSAEALGSEYMGQKISGLTGVGILSFNGNKIITTGGGGALVTRNEELATRIRHLSTTAKKYHAYEFDHDEVGYNFRMPALNAALGCSQLQKLDSFVAKKRCLYGRYQQIFKESDLGKIFNPDSFGQSNCWLNAFVLDLNFKNEKNSILEFLNARGICVRPFWKPLHTLEVYKKHPRDICSTAQELYERVICLPSSVSLVENE